MGCVMSIFSFSLLQCSTGQKLLSSWLNHRITDLMVLLSFFSSILRWWHQYINYPIPEYLSNRQYLQRSKCVCIPFLRELALLCLPCALIGRIRLPQLCKYKQ
uniref:Mannosyltransferase n=1 Tax=Ditylum brightwellii TaxID=49249 RepID=A0A7S4T4L8_9STRA